jgi:hypothetical protein
LGIILNCITIGGGIKALTTEHQMWFTGQHCPRKGQQPEQEQLITQKMLFTVQTIPTTAIFQRAKTIRARQELGCLCDELEA